MIDQEDMTILVAAMYQQTTRIRELQAALKVIGIEPPEFPNEPWSVLLNENGPEAGAETAEATAELFMDDLMQREKQMDALQARVAALEAGSRVRATP